MEVNNRDERLRRVIKYILMATILALANTYVPQTSLPMKDIAIIAIIGTITFATLDMYCPSVSKIIK